MLPMYLGLLEQLVEQLVEEQVVEEPDVDIVQWAPLPQQLSVQLMQVEDSEIFDHYKW